MEKTNTKRTEEKIFLGLGIISLLSGIALLVEGNYLAGVSGSIVGVWLAYDNFKKVNAGKNNE